MRSIDLDSSHSSDEEDGAKALKSVGVSTLRHHHSTYQPNIIPEETPSEAEAAITTETLNVLHCSTSELFPNIKPIYAPRWSSQLPEAYLPPTSNSESPLQLFLPIGLQQD